MLRSTLIAFETYRSRIRDKKLEELPRNMCQNVVQRFRRWCMPRSLARGAKVQPRREALLKAAVEVVGTQGLAGTTHRSVTEAAGVPLATASYYFSSIGELVAEALREFVQRRAAEMAVPALGELHGVLTPADIAGWYAAKVMELDVPHRLAFYEVLVNAPRSEELAGPARDALITYREATEAGLRAV